MKHIRSGILRRSVSTLRRLKRAGAAAGPARTRLLIIGAGEAGGRVVRDILARPEGHYEPVGFVDDDAAKTGSLVHGIRVLGTRADLDRIFGEQQPDEVLVAIPSAAPEQIRGILVCLEPYKVAITTLPQLRDLVSGNVDICDIRTLAFEDLLARAPIGLDPLPVVSLIAGRRILVTGAGGSIGGELCRQIANMAPASLVMLDRYENGLNAVQVELQTRPAAACIHAVIADVTDAARVDAVFERHQPEIVFHAAAHKHVPLMEDNPCEAIKNNVTGSRIVAEAAERHGVDRFILVSTDKAVNPTSVMGASKRLAELVIGAQARGSGTTFAIVRFGNVLGSNGSVVPLFLEQIRQGGPVTVTHRDVRRFFMLIPEAVQLVLHAAAQADNGATYLLEMGEQVRLLDMARHLIRLAGYVPHKDIAIEFVGLRPGEKLSEELIGDGEAVQPSRVDKILRVVDVARRTTLDALALIEMTEERAAANDTQGVIALLTRLLPAYNRPLPLLASADLPTVVPPPSAKRGADEVGRLVQQECPACRARGLGRARTRSLLERLARAVGEKRLFVCDECGWRGWLRPVDVGVAAHEAAAVPPDLNALDAAVDIVPFVVNRSFSPRHLS